MGVSEDAEVGGGYVDVPRDQNAGLAEDFEGAEGLVTEDVLEGSASCSLDDHSVQFASPSGGSWAARWGLGGWALRLLAQPAELPRSGGEADVCAEEKGEEGVDGVGFVEEGAG